MNKTPAFPAILAAFCLAFAWSFHHSQVGRAATPPVNTDGDGLSDTDESNIYGTNPLKWDTDGDGQCEQGPEEGREEKSHRRAKMRDSNGNKDEAPVLSLWVVKSWDGGCSPGAQ